MGIVRGSIILNFGISERLRAFRYPIFMGGVVEGDDICSAAFCESVALRAGTLPLVGAVAQRLRGFKSVEPEKTVKRSSRRTGVNLQFFPVQPSSLGLKGASSPFFVAPARRNRWHFSGSLLVSKENIPGGDVFCKRHQTLNTRLRSAQEALRHFPTQKRSNTCSITASEAFSPVRSHRAASASSTQTDTASSPKPPAAASSAPATASRARSAAES